MITFWRQCISLEYFITLVSLYCQIFQEVLQTCYTLNFSKAIMIFLNNIFISRVFTRLFEKYPYICFKKNINLSNSQHCIVKYLFLSNLIWCNFIISMKWCLIECICYKMCSTICHLLSYYTRVYLYYELFSYPMLGVIHNWSRQNIKIWSVRVFAVIYLLAFRLTKAII